jgi:hypothetical protein
VRILTFGTRTARTARAARATRTTIAAGTTGTTATRTTSTRAAVAAAGTGATRRTGIGAHPLGTIAAKAATRTTSARAAVTTAATGTTSAARTTRATWTARTARTTGTARATTTAIAEVTRRCRELPADACARKLATTGTVVILLLFLGRAELEAAEALGLVAIAAAAESTAATATAGTATTAALAATTTTTLAAATTAIITTRTLRAGDPIDHVVELAARDRTMRTLLALEHAHEANVVDATADDVERLEQARGAIGLHAECGCDRTDRRIFLRRCVGLRLAATIAVARRLGRCVGGLAAFRGGVDRLGCGCVC